MFYHAASQNMFAEDKDRQRNCASTEGELSQFIQTQRTSASSFIGNSLPAMFSTEPSHSEKSYYCVRKTRSTAGNPDPEMYLMPRESGWRECEVSYMSQDTKLTVITLTLSTSQTGIKYNSNKMIDQDLSCNGCLIPCICIYLRGYLLTSAGATGCAALLKICLLTLWEPHYRCSYISGLSHSRINAMRRTCTLRSQTLGWRGIPKGKTWENCSQNPKIVTLQVK